MSNTIAGKEERNVRLWAGGMEWGLDEPWFSMTDMVAYTHHVGQTGAPHKHGSSETAIAVSAVPLAPATGELPDGSEKNRATPIETPAYLTHTTKDGGMMDTTVSNTLSPSLLQVLNKPTITCDQDTRTGAISASFPKANAGWITTFKLERFVVYYGEMTSDSLSENWIKGNLGANGISYKGLKNGIYRIVVRQVPPDLTADQVDKDFGVTYSDTVTVRCQKFRKNRYRSVRCGVVGPLELNKQTYLHKLIPGDTVWAADFDVIIVKARKIGDGAFSGKGYVKMPKPFESQVGVTFENAVFNDDFELLKGKMEAAYDLNWEGTGEAVPFVKDAKVLTNTLEGAVSLAVDAQITISEIRIESMAEELVRNSRERLPDDLQEQYITAADELKGAKVAYNEAMTEEEQQTAERRFKAVQVKLAGLIAETRRFAASSESLIILSLLAIQGENNTTELNRVKDEVQAAAKVLNIPTTPEPPLLEQLNDALPGSSIVISVEDELPYVRTKEEEAYYRAQRASHKVQLASMYAAKMKNAEGAKQIGEALKREGMKLSDYIYESQKQKVENGSIIKEIKAVIYSELDKMLNEQVYKE